MSKWKKAWKALLWIARKPVLLNRVLTDEDTWKSVVENKYGLGEGLPVITMEQLAEEEALPASAPLGPMTFLDGGSLPTDMLLLAMLADQIPGCSYFEIGTWRGESAALISSRAETCHTLCLTDEEMRSRGVDESAIGQHRFFSRDLQNVVQHRGDSRNFDFALPGRKFDLIFIDGDHHFDTVVSDTRNVFRHLVHDRSIVVWHDYGFHPDRVRFEVMAAILEGAGLERRERIYHVAHTKCAVYTGKEYPASDPGSVREPKEYFTMNVSRHPVR
jgi:predicted O-methyltransferase YrrM